MRRRIGTCLLAVVMLAALAVPAMAAVKGNPVVTDESICDVKVTDSNVGRLDVTVKGVVSGAQYLVYMLSDDGTKVPTEANIQYIDQNGNGVFDVFPKDLKTGTYFVYVTSGTDSRFDGKQPVATVEFASDALYGDANGNGKVNSSDAGRILQYVVADEEEQATFFTDAQKINADVNKNEKINSSDAGFILQYVVADEEDQNQTFFEKFWKK